MNTKTTSRKWSWTQVNERRATATGILLLLLLLALPAVVQGQLTYTTTNNTITITGYTGTNGDVTIPDTINGLPVTSIGSQAFNECSYLTSVTIGTNVTSIGLFAFRACTSLTSVTIPNGVTNVGAAPFVFCFSLTNITVGALNSAYISVDGVLFDKNQTTLLEYPAGKTGTSYTIPNSVTSIGNHAFSDCASLSVTIPSSVTNIGNYAFLYSSLTNVTIPDSVTSIGYAAFSVCISLTNVTIPNSVSNIGDHAFDSCTSLANVTIGNGVTNIGDWAFYGCGSLTSVYFQGNAPSIGWLAFLGGGGMGGSWPDPTTVYFLPGTTGWSTNVAGRPAFLWDRSASMGYTTNNGTVTITRYTGPGGAVAIPSTINGLPVTTIGDYYADSGRGDTSGSSYGHWVGAFAGCSSLTSITIPNSVTSIGDYAFSDCTNLTSVTIPNSVTSLGTNAFWHCTSLTSVTIPNSVTSIGVGAFGACTSLMAITVDTRNSVFSDLDGVLFNQGLTTLVEYPAGLAGSYTIPNSVISIGGGFDSYGNAWGAFAGCSSLTGVTIPNSVTSIGVGAFEGCTSLTNIAIGDGVTSIGEWAFASCGSLTGIYSVGNAPSLDVLDYSDVFYGNTNATVYHLPGTTGWSNFSRNTGLPVMLWIPQVQTGDTSFGVRTNQFGFTINWASGMTVVVEATTNLANPIWAPVGTNTLTGGSSYFSDPQWTNYPNRFYRLRWP